LALLAQGHYAELYVRPPNPDWCYEDCFYVPECRWSLPVAKEEEKA
jgi:hypothetical protein